MYAQNFLKADPFDESMYRQLICFFLAGGQYGLAHKAFMDCREKMKEMDCPLSPQTLDFGNDLRGGVLRLCTMSRNTVQAIMNW